MTDAYEWRHPAPGAFGLDASMPGIDPMWLWAEASAYRDLGRPAPDPRRGLWFVADADRAGLGQAASPRFAGHRLTPADIARSGMASSALELAMPVVPERWPRRRARATPAAERDVQRSRSPLLVGIIDSGCPFAGRALRDADGLGTRVLGLWDQDEDPSFSLLDEAFRPTGLAYGRAVDRVALNRLMAESRAPDGWIDEERCYRVADVDPLSRMLSHGAAVVSRLFGRQPGRTRVDEPIDSADVVFVQASRAMVQDSTSAALARTIVDGLRFILDHVDPQVTRRVVVNISSGTSRGTHDGRSLIERAMDAFIDEQALRGVSLHIVVPTGNTHSEQRHALLSHTGEPLTFLLPADCEMPQYVTLRWPPDARRTRLRVTSPHGLACSLSLGEGQVLALAGAASPCAGVFLPPAGHGDAARGLIALAPTRSHVPDRALAPAGRWRFELVSSSPDEPVHFWISRNQRNPGALPRARQADFIDSDERHSPARHLRPTYEDPEEVVDGIARRGALSGLATLVRGDGKFVAVGAYMVDSPQRGPSDYSAAGPATEHGREGPDYSAVGDMGRHQPGLVTHANRSGEALQVTGTSFSAPLVARWLANGYEDPPNPDNQANPRLGKILPFEPVRP